MQEQVDERISVRFESKVIEEIDSLVKEMGFSNRSDFFRTAVRTQIDSQQKHDAISVEVAPLVLEYIDTFVNRGYYRSREHAIQSAIDGFFTEENMKETFRNMKRMEVIAGKKVEVGLESSTSRQMVTK